MRLVGSIGVVAAGVLAAGLANGATLDDVRERGHLQCGINTGLPGFAAPDDAGEWRGVRCRRVPRGGGRRVR